MEIKYKKLCKHKWIKVYENRVEIVRRCEKCLALSKESLRPKEKFIPKTIKEMYPKTNDGCNQRSL